jgi:hypothetical protein
MNERLWKDLAFNIHCMYFLMPVFCQRVKEFQVTRSRSGNSKQKELGMSLEGRNGIQQLTVNGNLVQTNMFDLFSDDSIGFHIFVEHPSQSHRGLLSERGAQVPTQQKFIHEEILRNKLNTLWLQFVILARHTSSYEMCRNLSYRYMFYLAPRHATAHLERDA